MHPKLARGMAGAGLAALLASASATLAQPTPADMARDAAMDRERPPAAAVAADRADRLRAMLQLRPDQEAALKAYMDAMAPREGARDEWRRERQAAADMTTPQRIDRRRARMAEHQKRFEQRASATLRFYGQLSPAQQKAFDAMGAGRGGMGRGRGHGHGMGPGEPMGHKPG